eukprot:CAMPEP_0170478802 /NCGR_PEP_ID=MMETSP0208-20121228/254_1 /TAXON_ID=197538 /ORGANISM="Strombidium inclinatum, Strain S3" /LENGTH=480 /DNA_ID=CAMNT_0010751117 /DNA_START=15 /DNA_END=1457 /DNA_ORIENTATION=-
MAAATKAAEIDTATGVNLGGWFVLEPWITPSLFYQFTGRNNTENQVAMDTYTFCEALGEDANGILTKHWDQWITEDTFKELKKRSVTWVRLPIGDWTLDPYGPYAENGCMDGVTDRIKNVFTWAGNSGINVLVDVHGLKDSQNGFDNSGRASKVTWEESGEKFHHWDNQEANWMGPWNSADSKYDNFNFANLQRSLRVNEAILKKWGGLTAFKGFQPVNEPWAQSDMSVLKDYYLETRKLVRRYSAKSTMVVHDAFQFDAELWNGMFEGDYEDVVLDHHYYQAWYGSDTKTAQAFCDAYTAEAAKADDFKMPVWFGEWSLATDVCAFWLGGFNDANTLPQQECVRTKCPDPYIDGLPNVDADKKILGPNGTMADGKTGPPDNAYVMSGNCTVDSAFFSDEDVAKIGHCAVDSFKNHVAATFFWTAHNELEAKWDYIRAWDMGWINQTAVDPKDKCDPWERYMANPKFARATQESQLQFLS